MGSLTARGRVLVVLAFLASAALCAGAAVAFVMATDDKSGTSKAATLPSVHPTLVFPSEQPSATPSQSPTPAAPTATPTPTVTAAPTTTPAATPAATSSPAPRRTTTPKPSPTRAVTEGLSASASLNYGTGGTTADLFKIIARATDGNGTVSLQSLDWGDGSALVKGGRGSACTPAATPPADCRNFSWTHHYSKAGAYIITVAFVSGKETSILHLQAQVGAAPSPSPSAT